MSFYSPLSPPATVVNAELHFYQPSKYSVWLITLHPEAAHTFTHLAPNYFYRDVHKGCNREEKKSFFFFAFFLLFSSQRVPEPLGHPSSARTMLQASEKVIFNNKLVHVFTA